MYKILAKWDYTPRIILIRDKRHGKYESFVPTLEWFDRLALLVKIDSVEKVYDFDPSIQNNYENPWFFNSVQFFVVDEDKGFNKDFSFATTPDKNTVIEKHTLKISPDLH